MTDAGLPYVVFTEMTHHMSFRTPLLLIPANSRAQPNTALDDSRKVTLT